MSGKTIRIYLVDGVASGIITAEIINWTGRAIVAPIAAFGPLASRTELYKTGIYVLSGTDPDSPGREAVYIGESDNVWERLQYHENDDAKSFASKIIAVVSKDDNLTKAHVRYLESRLIQLGRSANRARIWNSNNTELPNLPESDISDMEFFLSQVEILFPVLGFSFALPVTQSTNDNPTSQIQISSDQDKFTLSYGEARATAQIINNEFIVLKDSTLLKQVNASLSKSNRQIREQLESEGKLIDHSSELSLFAQNVPFSSPSAAASVISGTSINGRVYWKHLSQITYAEWQENQIKREQEKLAQQDSDFV